MKHLPDIVKMFCVLFNM